jgi:hypothetical protein
MKRALRCAALLCINQGITEGSARLVQPQFWQRPDSVQERSLPVNPDQALHSSTLSS